VLHHRSLSSGGWLDHFFFCIVFHGYFNAYRQFENRQQILHDVNELINSRRNMEESLWLRIVHDRRLLNSCFVSLDNISFHHLFFTRECTRT
jgi:hypothetical protein